VSLQDVLRLYSTWGHHRYDEDISQLSHGLQCANLARQQGSSDELVAAALLHDVGHLLELDRKAGNVDVDLNDRHDQSGADYLSLTFGPEVTEPIRWHVQAKRYLCTVDEEYHNLLSCASKRSLEFQGGPMNSDEVAEFERNRYFNEAIALRLWDEGGKDRETMIFGIEHYLPVLVALASE
jgi:phosphonate degradation associated HDIG domain protein